MVIGLASDADKAYGNWGGTDKGIAVGWNASEVGTSTVKAMTGNGTDTTRYNATAGQLQDDATYYIRIEVAAAASETTGGTMRIGKVTVQNLDTGVKIIDGIQIPAEQLPPAQWHWRSSPGLPFCPCQS